MHHDKRRFPRVLKAESLSLTVVSANVPAGQGERIYCESVDISPTGLQVIMDRFLAKDSRVEIWLVLLEDRQTFLLQGKLTWVDVRKDSGAERFHAGIQLLPTTDSDFERWLAQFIEP
jgi:hypothetical protein